MLRLCIPAPLLFVLLLQPLCAPVQCLNKLKLTSYVSLEPSNLAVAFPSKPCGESAFVKWDPPSMAFLIKSYRVTCEARVSHRVVKIVEGSLTESEIGPLQDDSTYRCFVASVSKIYGISRPVASEVFSTNRSCPSPPNNVVASFSSKPPSCLNNANVSWDPSLTTDIDTYFVECASNFDSFNITVDGNATSAVFGNLTSPMVEYRCTVEAINSAGKSQPAFARPFVTTTCQQDYPEYLPQCNPASPIPGDYFDVVSGTGTLDESSIVRASFVPSVVNSKYSITTNIIPAPTPILETELTAASICSDDSPFVSGPSKARSICQIFLAASIESVDEGFKIDYSRCSGTFIGDKDGLLMFLTAAHCAVDDQRNPFIIQDSLIPDTYLSFVQCNREVDPVNTTGDGYFQIVGASIVRSFVSVQETAERDGALLLVQPLEGTDLSYATPYAAAAITDKGLAATRPTYSAGIPQIDSRFFAQGCTEENLGTDAGRALFYSRSDKKVLYNPGPLPGLVVEGFSACGGSSGGPLMDEEACVVYGALSYPTPCASLQSSNSLFNYNGYGRIVNQDDGEGIYLTGLINSLQPGSPKLA